MGIGIGIMSLFGGKEDMNILSGLIPRRVPLIGFLMEEPFLVGLFSMVFMVISAVFALAYFYFMSEIIYVLVDIANNTRQSHKEKANEIVIREGAPTKCPKCDAKINSDDKFCGECGHPLTEQQ